MFRFYRFNAILSIKREPYHTKTLTVFRDLTLKILFWWSLLEKRESYRDEFLHEKSLKIDIYAERFALTSLFSCADRAFYKNAQIYTPIRFALTRFNIIAHRFALLFEINQNAETVFIFKYDTARAYDLFAEKR
jgi:hypothetical protein